MNKKLTISKNINWSLLKSLKQLIFIIDHDGTCLFVNHNNHKHLVGSGENHIGKKLQSCIFDLDINDFNSACKKASTSESINSVYIRLGNLEKNSLFCCDISCFDKEASHLMVAVSSTNQLTSNQKKSLPLNQTYLQLCHELSLDLFDEVQSNSKNFFGIQRLDGSLEYISDNTSAYLGYSIDTILLKGIYHFIQNKKEIELLKKHFKKVVTKQVKQTKLIHSVQTKSGEKKWLEVSLSFSTFSNKERILAIATDLTHQQREIISMQKKLHQDNIASAIADNIDGMVAQYKYKDGQPHLLFLSKGTEKLIGKLNTDNIKKDPTYIMTNIHKDPEKIKSVMLNAIKYKKGWNENFTYIINNKEKTVHCQSSIREDYDGSLIITNVTIDISDQIKLETKASQLLSELNQLIDTANAPIFGIDPIGNINEWNQKTAEITGFTKNEVLGKSLVQTYITEDYKNSVKSVLDDSLQGKETSNYEVPIFTKDGRRVVILLNATTRRDVNGKIIGVIGVGQDISEIDFIRKELLVQNKRHNEIEKFNKSFSWEFNLLNEDVHWSNNAWQLLNLPKRKVTKKYFFSLLSDESKTIAKKAKEDLLKKEIPISIDISFKHLPHKIFNETKNIICDKNNIPIKIFGQIQDVTTIRQLEKNKQKMSEELTQLIDTANAPIFGIDISGKINEWNQKTAEITGFTKNEVLGKSLVQTYITEDYKNSVKSVLDDALQGKETSNYEVPIFTKNGDRVMILLNATTRRNMKGHVIGVIGVGQNITKIIETQSKLEHQINLFDTIEKSHNSFSWEYDIKTKKVIWSNNVSNVLKLPTLSQAPTYKSFHNLIDEKSKKLVELTINNLLKNKKPVRIDLKFKHLPEEIFQERKHVKCDEKGAPIKLFGEIENISKLRKIERDLIKAEKDQAIAEEKNRLKSDFLANMSHELRTPMTSIMGYSQLLDNAENISKKQQRFVNKILENSNHLLNLINGLLDLSKIEAGEMSLDISKNSISKHINHVISIFKPKTQKSKHNIILNLNHKNDTANFDETKFHQVMLNLISNAIKFSPNNSNITVTTSSKKQELKVCIEDEGTGIPTHLKNSLFDRFTQSKKTYQSSLDNPIKTKKNESESVSVSESESESESETGTGLGLALCKGLVELQGGKIWLDETFEKGAKFCFVISLYKDITLK